MENTRAEEEVMELITEWPVTSTYNEEDSCTSTSLTSVCCHPAHTPPLQMDQHDACSIQHRLGKRQHQCLSTKHHADEAEEGEKKRKTMEYSEDCVVRTIVKHQSTSDSVTCADCGFRSDKKCEHLLDKDKRKGSNAAESIGCFISAERSVELQKCGSTSTPFALESQDKCVKSAAEPELLAQPRIARWWRRHGQQLVSIRGQEKTGTLPETSSPNTLLFHVARLPEGRAFLESEREALKKQSEECRGRIRADVLAAVGSIEDWLGLPDEAVHSLQQAVAGEPDNKEWRWLLHKVQRQQKVWQRQQELRSTLPLQLSFPPAGQVERVSCKDLTFADFFHRYASQRCPVIITDMVSSMTTVPWDLQHIRNVAGDLQVRVKRAVRGSVEWAGLEDCRQLTVHEFLDRMELGSQDYLFDWSLPLHCPRLTEELTIPRYFAGDFLQRSAQGSLYQDSWPSLFIAPPGVHSGLHVDAFTSNFWMALFQGRKRWLFFHEEDMPCLYPVYAHSLDPTFEASVVSPNLTVHPLLAHVHPIECVLSAGELLYVPGGSPHYVENLDTTLAISSNFVDLTNFSRVLDELDVNGLVDPRAADLADQFRCPGFVSAMKADIGDLSWKEFKSWPPKDLETYCLENCGDENVKLAV